MELLAPAGNIEKLKYAYQYGADAAYIGIKNFSLRAKADNFGKNEVEYIKEIKGNKKLYCALNIFFHNQDIKNLEAEIDQFADYPFDAFIISDLGILNLLKKRFPDREIHLSTQANCVNGEAAKIYRDLGFSRLILGRETPLKDIYEIKKAVPEVELETFVHGAMCMSYSGRCFLSKMMTGRSANQGSCAHSCRWSYKVLEEKERPGEYYPIEEGDNYTTVMSSKDLCMIDYIQELKDAGIDSLKIEGRMKSIYYAAVITRAYRKMIDSKNGIIVPDLEGFREEIFKVSHREFSTGFYFDKEDIEESTTKMYERQFAFLGSIGEKLDNDQWSIDVKNQIKLTDEIEFIGPDLLFVKCENLKIYDVNGEEVVKADHGKQYTITTSTPLKEGYIIRKKAENTIAYAP
ncbi:MAG: U32 family peptidase [Spirochaetaceae bacterium]|jgi:putative protease|nr:U32 family peptidase [Spirochaetaceae bacterium]